MDNGADIHHNNTGLLVALTSKVNDNTLHVVNLLSIYGATLYPHLSKDDKTIQ